LAQDRKQPSAQAGIRFEKAQKQAREGEQAWAEYEASGRAADINRARLKALRLAKEAAEKEAEPAPKKAAASSKAASSKKASATPKKAAAAPKKAAAAPKKAPDKKP